MTPPRNSSKTQKLERKPTPRAVKQVTVLYFPKGGRPFRNRITQTDVSVPVIDDVVTEVEAVAPKPSAPPHKPSPAAGRRRRTKEQPAVAAEPASKSPQEVADLAVFGHELFEQGRIEEARVIFEGLVSTGATEAFPHTMLGTIYLAMGDQERALALFQAALDLDASDLAARVYRGEIRLSKGKLKSATEDLKRAISQGDAGDPFVERAERLLQLARGAEKRTRR